MIDLKGLRAMVCGSTQGIGRSCAVELAQAGATVTLVARNPDTLAHAVAELSTSAGQAHDSICQDFSDPPALADKVRAHVEVAGLFHILVNNTGGPPGGPLLEAKPQAFLTAMSNHLVCNQLLVQALVPGMKRLKYGRIINIISLSVKTPLVGLGVSNTTRGAVASWAKTLASELGGFGITVNNVLPGFIGTDRLFEVIADRAKAVGVEPTEMEKRFVEQVPAGRFGQPKEIGQAVCFLASPAATYVNGINLPVDGGRIPTL